MLSNLKNIFKVPDLRNKIFFLIVMVAVYRLGVAIRVPGIDQDAVKQFKAEMGLISPEASTPAPEKTIGGRDTEKTA